MVLQQENKWAHLFSLSRRDRDKKTHLLHVCHQFKDRLISCISYTLRYAGILAINLSPQREWHRIDDSSRPGSWKEYKNRISFFPLNKIRFWGIITWKILPGADQIKTAGLHTLDVISVIAEQSWNRVFANFRQLSWKRAKLIQLRYPWKPFKPASSGKGS